MVQVALCPVFQSVIDLTEVEQVSLEDTGRPPV